jgi:hypothetical protein
MHELTVAVQDMKMRGTGASNLAWAATIFALGE